MINRNKIHTKLRFKVSGTASRPRLAVYRSLQNVFAQLIDDENGVTLASASSFKEKGSLTQKAKIVGGAIAKAAAEKKIKTAVYDRGGFAYKGAVKTLCEAARENGLTI
jgi:large subunit ribosomal protein L18